MLTQWFGGWMIRLAEIGGRYALQLFGVVVASALALSVPSTAQTIDRTDVAAARIAQHVAGIAPNVVHKGVRVANVPLVKTVENLNPGPIDDWYPMDTVGHIARLPAAVAQSAAGDVREGTTRLLLPCRGVACTGLTP